jgi:hypothetical protein
VPPAQELDAQRLGNGALPDEKVEYRAPESFHEQPLRDRGTRDKEGFTDHNGDGVSVDAQRVLSEHISI